MLTREDLLKEYQELAPYPAVLLRLSEIVLSGTYTIDDIVNVIKYDQGITVDVIRYSNSVESSSSRSIASLQDAIVRMGGSRILRYLLARWFYSSVSSALKADRQSKAFWQHGVISALASEVLSEEFPKLSHQDAFTTALLHDIGMIPLSMHAMKMSLDFDWSVFADDLDTELKLFGNSHAETGAMLLEYWGFPLDMVDAVRFHSLGEGGPSPLSDLVRMSSYFAAQTALDVEMREKTFQGFGVDIDKTTFQRIITKLESHSFLLFDELKAMD
ncbi:MAG: HDOD domain-containing protein [Fibrobacter sp.]|nr:HDOD domain-containing protein [Fibrobacter sp.]